MAGNETFGNDEQAVDPPGVTARETTSGVSWNFTTIPIFPPDRANRSSLGAAPLPDVLQPKLVIGQVDDPLE
jgi:hypothetical protein